MWKRTSKTIELQSRLLSTVPKDVKSQIPKAYSPDFVEDKWYQWWESNSFFQYERPTSATEKFSMVLPPPNITGTLHLGHALTCAIQDSLISWNRMRGKHTVWFPGCDHAGIATQVILEKHLSSLNIQREQLGREKFVAEIWKWKEEKENTIFQQLRTLGATLQWDKKAFTMDPEMCYAVNEAFIRLHRSGKIYRKESLINWSCHLQSAISDVEVDHKLINEPTGITIPGYEEPIMFGYLYKFEYCLLDSDERIAVSTTRPETVFGDTAIAVHPEDNRFTKYIGKLANHPLRNVPIPIIADRLVDPQFGTGALKITPGHDLKDFEIAKRHNLDIVNIFDNRGFANENCGTFRGLPRFELREKVISFLCDNRFFHSTSPHQMSVPVCSRSGDIIELLLRPQWFVDTKEMANQAIKAVTETHLRIHPCHFENVWFDWLSNIKDWCISRQIWWGHRIPAYQLLEANQNTVWITAHNAEEAIKQASQLGLSWSSIQQDEDVLDTWFSSSLFPFTVCGWPKKQVSDFQHFFPLDIMETGHDILFFWVARMVMMSLELTGKLPFKDVLLHGIVCDSQGRKMSKSLGNVIDPLDIVYGASLTALENKLQSSRQQGHLSQHEYKKALEEKRTKYPDGIPQMGADSLRFTLCSYNVKNHFINLDMTTVKRNRLFCNKIWQVTRYLFLALDRTAPLDSQMLKESKDYLMINQWIMSSLNNMVYNVDAGLSRYDFHHATEALYNFLYTRLCDVYIEAIKPLTEQNQKESLLVLAVCLDVALRCLAPFMPFLSEELYQRLHEKLALHEIKLRRSPSILIAHYPTKNEFNCWKNVDLENNVELILRASAELRKMKLEYGLFKSKPNAIILCSSELILNRVHEFSKLVMSVVGLNTANIYRDLPLTVSNRKDLISRTVDQCSVHLVMPGIVDEQNELVKNREKLRKLIGSLNRLEASMNSPSYQSSAPLNVQESHERKIAALQAEIRQLEDHIKALEA